LLLLRSCDTAPINRLKPVEQESFAHTDGALERADRFSKDGATLLSAQSQKPPNFAG
jgi:hypothetical protein